MRDTPIGGKPDPVPPPPLPPLFPVETLLRQLRLIHVVFVLVIFALGTAWGLKLEYRMDQARGERDMLAARVVELERVLARGILPLAEERLSRLAVRFEQVIGDHGEMRQRIEAVSAAVERINLLQTQCALEADRKRSRLTK